jgi:hypothetical protein
MLRKIVRKHGPGQRAYVSFLCVEMNYPNTTLANSRVFRACPEVSPMESNAKWAQLPESVVTL